MTVKIKNHSRSWATVETEYGSFKLSSQPYVGEVVVKVDGDKAAVGYLLLDEDCPDPLEDCDGMGHIYTSNRHAGNEQHQKMQAALGLNSEWEPDLESLREDAEVGIILEAAKKIDADAFAVEWFGRDYDVGEDMWHVAFTDPSREQNLLAAERYDWENGNRVHRISFLGKDEDVRDWEDLAKEMWLEGRANGTIGNKWAVSLDVYEHSGISYSVSGEGMQCQWDTARGGAVWVPDKDLIEDIESHPENERTQRARELARQACEEYTSWCNGYCYGAVVEEFKREGEDGEWIEKGRDSCWGYIGYECAMSELKTMVNSTIAY